MSERAPGNDNDAPPVTTVTIADLAAALGVDEDTILRRIAGVLDKRLSTPQPAPEHGGEGT
jgi:hypothetical protein